METAIQHRGGVLPRDDFRFIPLWPNSGELSFIMEVAESSA